jgi:nucleoside-diphosphate-sugar epimerase
MHEGTINEYSAFNAPSLYGRSKLAGEFVVSAAASFSILRLVYLYGSGLENGSFLPNIIKSAREKNKIILYGKGVRKQDYLHVDDAAQLCIKAMNFAENDIFLGASGCSYSNLDIAKIISSNIKGCIIEHLGIDNGNSFYFDPSITCQKLDWKPKADIVSEINKMIKCAG